jgi:hypothetical protein
LNSFLRASQLHATILNKKWGVQEPNSESNWHNEDTEQSFKEGGKGTQIRTSHLTQDYDWSKHPFTYKWNSLGLRGPDPDYNATKKILVIGSSLTIGQGVPVENCFIDLTAKELGYDYINLSEFYVLTDSIQQATKIAKEYKPDIVIVSTTRHLFSSEFILRHLFPLLDNSDKKEIAPLLWEVFVAEAKKQVFMFEQAILGNCKEDTKMLWFGNTESSGRKWKFGEMITEESVYEFSAGKHVTFDIDEYIVDLGRDNKHPGIQSNIRIKELLVNTIKGL